jgi:ankyrin repeat protein
LVGEFTRTKHVAFHINEQAAHTQLALLCMCYIAAYIKCGQQSSMYEGLPRDDSDVIPPHGTGRLRSSLPPPDSHPLLEYVQLCGFDHLDYANVGNSVVLRAIETLQSDVQQYPSDWERLCERTHSFYPPWPTPKHDLALYILVTFAPEPLLRLYIGRSKLKLKDGTNPLIYAAHFYKVEHARTLLSSGVSLNRTGWSVGPDPYQVLPLKVAVDCMNHLVVELFLMEGSPVPHELFVTALEKQSRGVSAPIVARLLQTDQFVEWATASIRDEGLLLRALDPTRYLQFLPHSTSDQDIDVIQRRLVQIGYDPSSHFDQTSLRHAASAGHVSAVKRMLASNIPIPPDIILDASRGRGSDSSMIRLFLDRGCDVDVVSPTGDTALHCVIWGSESRNPEDDCLQSVQVLVDAGCNPSACNLVGDTPLHLAASLGYVSVIKYLLSQHAPLPPDILLLKPLPPHQISLHSTIRFLIREGADVHILSANGNTPLHLLLANFAMLSDECLECVKILIDAGCNPCLPNALGETPFDVAAKNGHLPVVEYLFSLDSPLSPSILLSASGCGFWSATPIIKFLINKGANTHVTCPNGDTVLHLSTRANWEVGSLQRIKIFVNAGCDARACNIAGNTPFHIAARQRHISVMEYLISIGTSVPPDIMLAAFEQDDQFNPRSCCLVIRFLLERGGDIQVATESGDSLLHLATTLDLEHDSLEVVKELVRAGCSPRVLNSAHETPLHTAAEYGRISVIKYFLSLDIPLPPDILLAAPRGYTHKENLIRFLIENGANPHAVTTNGNTPLHLILTDGDEADRLESVKLLIDAGCDTRARNAAGETVLHVAATHGFVAVLKYLLSQDLTLPDDLFLASIRTIHFLIDKGIDLRSVATNYGDAGEVILSSYDDEGCLECVRILIRLGWDFSSRDSAGDTAIHIVARLEFISTLRYLLSQNVPLPADVLLATVPSDELLCTPNTVPLIHFLIHEGANVNVTASNGDTPCISP